MTSLHRRKRDQRRAQRHREKMAKQAIRMRVLAMEPVRWQDFLDYEEAVRLENQTNGVRRHGHWARDEGAGPSWERDFGPDWKTHRTLAKQHLLHLGFMFQNRSSVRGPRVGLTAAGYPYFKTHSEEDILRTYGLYEQKLLFFLGEGLGHPRYARNWE